MQLLVLLLTSFALAGVTPATTGHLSVATTAELVVSEEDTVSGTAGMLVGLDEAAWDTDEFGPAEDAAPDFEFTAQDLASLADEVVADLEGVTIEVVARGDDPFGRSGLTIGFAAASFAAVDTVFERLQADERISLALSLQRQAGQPHSPEGGGQQHILDGALQERTVRWTDSGDASAVAAAQAYGRTRERHGEIPPPRSEVDGFQPVHH